jgi:hypothetical protein
MFVLSEEPEENGQSTYMCESIQSAIPLENIHQTSSAKDLSLYVVI